MVEISGDFLLQDLSFGPLPLALTSNESTGMPEHLRTRELWIAEAVIERAVTVDVDVDVAWHRQVEADSVTAVSSGILTMTWQ